MAIGTLDANGVYIYGEDDPASPVSDLLNLGMDSVSDAVGDAKARLTTLETIGAPTAYTPVLTAATTNPTLGTGGSTTGRFVKVGKLVAYWFNVTFGTSGADAGSGYYKISLPVPAATAPAALSQGTALITAAGKVTPGHCVLLGSTDIRVYYTSAAINGTVTAVGNAVPGVFTNNDSLRGHITYEAA